jgi:hypothetical protein
MPRKSKNAILKRFMNIKGVRDMTPKQLGCLEVMINPEHRGKSNAEKAALAGCSLSTWENTSRRPDIITVQAEIAREMLKADIAPLLKATMDYAINNSSAHQDRRMLLEMMGIYKPQKDINVNQKSLSIEMQISKAPQDELRQALAQYVNSDPDIKGLLSGEIIDEGDDDD